MTTTTTGLPDGCTVCGAEHIEVGPAQAVRQWVPVDQAADVLHFLDAWFDGGSRRSIAWRCWTCGEVRAVPLGGERVQRCG